MIRFKMDGQEYEFDETKMLVHEARLIKEHAKLGLLGFGQGLREGDPDAIVALLFLAKRRAGIACRWKDFDGVDLNAVDIIADEPESEEDDKDKDEAAQPADPTNASGGGKTRKR